MALTLIWLSSCARDSGGPQARPMPPGSGSIESPQRRDGGAAASALTVDGRAEGDASSNVCDNLGLRAFLQQEQPNIERFPWQRFSRDELLLFGEAHFMTDVNALSAIIAAAQNSRPGKRCLFLELRSGPDSRGSSFAMSRFRSRRDSRAKRTSLRDFGRLLWSAHRNSAE